MESDVGTPSHIPTGAKRAEALPLLRQSRIADVIAANSLLRTPSGTLVIPDEGQAAFQQEAM